jgi:uncharacterized phage infection (PIP) family protein YhgE
MSFFSPEIIFRSLVSSLGVSPDDVRDALQMLFSELSTLKAERDAFKVGAAGVVQHFSQRLDTQDERLARIETLLETIRQATMQPQDITPLRLLTREIAHA